MTTFYRVSLVFICHLQEIIISKSKFKRGNCNVQIGSYLFKRETGLIYGTSKTGKFYKDVMTLIYGITKRSFTTEG